MFCGTVVCRRPGSSGTEQRGTYGEGSSMEGLELKGRKVNIEKTKVMRSGKSGGEIVKTGRWACAVCRKGVGANSI